MKTGQRFGKLQVISPTPKMRVRDKSGKMMSCWLCRCDCGTERYFRGPHLTSGRTKSCGCTRGQNMKGRTPANKKTPEQHALLAGYRRTKKSWDSMISRCTRPYVNNYQNYGGRGITVCERWMKFENFLADMGERPEGLTLERIENDKGYEPGNCKWATWEEQASNRRNTVMVIAPDTGKKEPLIEAAKRFSLPLRIIYYRLKRGWPVDKAFTWPEGYWLLQEYDPAEYQYMKTKKPYEFDKTGDV